MNTIIYTCIIGGYDTLQEITTKHQAICFTDTDIKSATWEIVKIKLEPKIFRKVKICPHLFLPKHDRNVWIDGNCVFDDIDKIIEPMNGFNILKHWKRNCVYAEAVRCIETGKDKEEIIMKQINKYYHENYPFNNGMVESSVMVRDNTEVNKKFGKLWWSQVRRYSVRDQISFNYVAWKTGLHYKTFYPMHGFKRNPHASK